MLLATCSRTFLRKGEPKTAALCGRLVDRLAGVLRQLGLGVEALEVADAAAHHQPDDPLGPRREMGLAVGRAPAANGSARTMPSRWSIAPSARPTKPMPVSARKPGGVGPEQSQSAHVWFMAVASVHRIVTKSLWFSSTWTSADRARASGVAGARRLGRERRSQPGEARRALGPLRRGRRPGRGCARRPSPRRPSATQVGCRPRGRSPPRSRWRGSETIPLLVKASACCGTIVSWRR